MVNISQKNNVPLEPQLKVALTVKMSQKAPRMNVGNGEDDCLFMKTSL